MIFSFFKRHRRIKANGQSLPPPSPAAGSNEEGPKQPVPLQFDPIKWARDNPWLIEGQPDDRLPVNGAVASSGRTPAEQRSFARSTHQAMFKKWSRARHD